MSNPFPGFVSPLPPGTTFGRIDQGVDYDAPSAVLSVGDGVVVKISPPGSWAGGTGEAVYIKLASPVTVNGHTYSQVYYAERRPLVQVGQQVAAGSPVMAAGSNELGFARNGQPACPLVGGLGAGTQPTICGQDFYAFVQVLHHASGVPIPPPPSSSADAIAPQAHEAFTRLQLSLLKKLPANLNRTQEIAKSARRLLARRR